MKRRSWFGHILAALGALPLLVSAAAAPSLAADTKTQIAQIPAVADDQVCLQHIRKEEKAHRIPKGLLAAIGLTESGRALERGQMTVWPWTVNAAGEGHYFESKADAIAFVEGKLADGVESIDVGCMQINLKHHPDAFASLEDAFDPATNAAYGADFLTSLRGQLNGWLAAARRYHSATPEKGEAYGERVLANWNGPAKEKELAATAAVDDTAPANMQVATAAGFLRAAPVRANADGNLSLFSRFYTPAALTQAERIKPPAPATQVAAAQLQPGAGQIAAAEGETTRSVSTQKMLRRRVAPGQTGLSLKDYRTN